MFKSIVHTVAITCLASVLIAAGEAQGAATLSLKAVAKNGTPLVGGPVNALNVARGDTVTAEVFVFGWGTPPYDSPTNTALVRGYQATLLGAAGAISNGGNSTINAQLVLPVGWDAPIARDSCPCDPTYPNCDPAYGCVGNAFNPNSMASTSIIRSDYIFFGFSTIQSVDLGTLNVKWGGTVLGSEAQSASRCSGGTADGEACTMAAHCPGGACNPNFMSYLGTLNLQVGTQACGTYTFNFSDAITNTFIHNPESFPITVVPALQGLTLTVSGFACAGGACCDTTNPNSPTCTNGVTAGLCTGAGKRYGGDGSTCANIEPPCAITTGACCNESTGVCTDGVTQANCTGRYGGNGSTCANINPACIPPANQITAVDPPHCTIDARRPYPGGTPASREGYKAMTLTFQNLPGTGEDAANDFQVTQIPAAPAPPNPPTIASVVPGAGNTVTLNFNVPIQVNRWTCVRHNASNKRRCLGYLPADADSNRTANPSDILKIIDNLNGVANPPLLPNQCDTDRSGGCSAPDILGVIDLLNGANSWPIQNGKTLEVCPSIDVP